MVRARTTVARASRNGNVRQIGANHTRRRGSPLADKRTVLRAALTWDQPELLRDGSPEARLFFDAMSRGPLTNEEHADKRDPVAAAGLGFWAAINDDTPTALRMLDTLAKSRGKLTSLLGLNMLAWLFSAERPDALIKATELVASVSDASLRARLATKLLALSLDYGDRESATRLWLIASQSATRTPALAQQLKFVGLNNGLGPVEIHETDVRVTGTYDPLVDYPWIRNRAHRGAHRALVEIIKSTVRSPWTATITWGRTAFDDTLAAEMQATWAGAIWLRADIRLELASLLLAGAARTSAQFAYACSLWIRSGGQDMPRVIDWAERRFDEASADWIIAELAPLRASRLRDNRYVETALSVWDLVSVDVANMLLATTSVDAGDNPFAQSRRALWSVLALRVPEQWRSSFGALPHDTKVKLASESPAEMVMRLPASLAIEFKQLLYPSTGEQGIDDNAVVAFAAASQRAGDLSGTEWLRNASALDLSRILPKFASLVGQESILRAATELGEEIQREVDQAKQGTWSVGPERTAMALLRVLLALESVPRNIIRPLIATATDDRVPGDLRLESWQALHQLSLRRQLPDDYRRWIQHAPVRGAPSFFGDVTETLLEALRESVMTSYRVNTSSVALHVTAARDPDPRVRQVAIESSARVLRHRRVSLLETTLVSGLYDPEGNVVLSALSGFKDAHSISSTLVPSIVARLGQLFESYGRDVRAAVLTTSASLSTQTNAIKPLDQLIQYGDRDRSWIVRDAALRAREELATNE
jgi:hypothetical protein